jgi:predicted exporter
MNLADFIVPALGAVSGAAVAYFSLDKRQAVSEAKLTAKLEAMEKALAEQKAEHMRSAASQGTRIEALIDDVGTLKDFRARTEGREQQRELSEAHDGRVR